MEPVEHVSVEDVRIALRAEALHRRAWLPPEPYWASLLADEDAVSTAIATSLVRGMAVPGASVVNARKFGHGVRPIAVLSPEARVVYRALAKKALGASHEPPDRSADAYAEFVLQPIKEGFEGLGRAAIGASRFKYVVTSDISSFYDYLDHDVLRSELDLWQADIRSTDALVDLLGDISGKRFGIPQQSDVSDWLADIVAARVGNDMIRLGYEAWRYSDDFRIGCKTYSEALAAIEDLAESTRELGLIINDSKTLAPSFFTYLIKNSTVEVDDISAEIDPEDVEAAVTSDYLPENDAQAIDDAITTMTSLGLRDELEDQLFGEDEEAIDLRKMDADAHRAVRRSLNTLAKHENPAALPALRDLLAFQPAMTHRVIAYLEAVAPADPASAGQVVEAAIGFNLNGWQRAWLAYAYRGCGLAVERETRGHRWLDEVFQSYRTRLDGAEAALTLAHNGLVGIDALDRALREAPDDLAPWYLRAIASLPTSPRWESRRAAYMRASPIWAALLAA